MKKQSKRNKKLNKNRYTKNRNKNNKKELSIITDGITERNELLEQICLLPQNRLKAALELTFTDNNKETISDDGFLYVKGSIPILLVAHMDTVHKELPTEMIYANGTLSSPQGIGADDRAGIYMILEILKQHDCSVLFCEDEEVGCIGTEKFCKSQLAKELAGTFNYIIELDRMNANDAVFYECDNPEFTEFITKEYWKLAEGSYTDIVELSPVLEAASVNFSCGYYKQHTNNEYLVLSEMENNIKEVCKLIDRTDMEIDKYEYIERDYFGFLWGIDSNGNKNENFYGSGYGDIYFIIYFDINGFQQVDEVSACSPEEAIGYFLIEHNEMTYLDIMDIVFEDDYYENYI